MKQYLKAVARGLSRIVVLPAYGLFLIQGILCDPARVFPGYSQCFALIPGLTGEYLRREFYRLTLTGCAPSVCICFGTVFSKQDVELHENVYIGAYCIIGQASIGKDTLLASRVSIISGKHQHGTERLDAPMREQQGVLKKVRIGQDCWIGEGAIIGADVGAHSIVGAGAVVLKEVGKYAVMSGNPAELVRTRKD